MKFFDDNNANDSKTSPKICSVITEIGSHTTDPEEVEQLNTHEIPILALRNMVLFPEVAIPVAVGRKESLALIEEVQRTHALIGVICQKEESVDKPQFNDLHRVGVVADVLKVLEFPDGSTNVILQGKYPFELESITQSEPFLMGQIHTFGNEKPQNGDKEFDVLISAIKDIAINMLNNLGNKSAELVFAIKNIDNSEQLINYLCANTPISPDDKQKLLEETSIKNRAYMLYSHLNREAQFVEIKADIESKTQKDITEQQRAHFLQQQIRTIQDELGDTDENDINEFYDRAEKKNWSESVKAAFEKELHKLERLQPQSPDYSVQYTYLETLLDLPWGDCTEDNFDLKNAEKQLDEDHYGLDKVKDRILEQLAVLKLRGDMKAPILCLYGPPGVGKTSLGKSIADALNRKYVRISLGGPRRGRNSRSSQDVYRRHAGQNYSRLNQMQKFEPRVRS